MAELSVICWLFLGLGILMLTMAILQDTLLAKVGARLTQRIRYVKRFRENEGQK